MKFTNDICLILPEKEDKLDKKLSSWINLFRKNLNTILKRNLKRDLQFRVLVPDAKSGISFLEESAVSVIFMDGSFTGSTNFIKLLDALNEKIDSKKELQIQEGRITKLAISGSGQELASTYLKYIPAAEFFSTDDEKGESLLDIDSIYYWSRLLDISTGMQKIIIEGTDPSKTESEERALIFLANTTEDQDLNRELLRREFLQHGHLVEPDIDLRFLPGDPGAYLQSILKKAKVAVHIFGNDYGKIFGDSKVSLPEYQMDLVSAFIDNLEKENASEEENLIRLIWISPEIAPVDEKQIAFLSQVRQNIEKLQRTEIIQAPVELFKSIILKRLRQFRVTKDKPAAVFLADRKTVYIIHDKRDEAESVELMEKFTAAGMNAVMIDFHEGQANLINKHKENLVRCDATLIVYGHTNRFWLSSKVKDLLKAPGFGRENPLVAKGLLVSGEDDLKGMSLPDDLIMVNKKEALKPFIEKLKQ